MAELLQSSVLSTQQRSLVQTQVSCCDALLSLVNDILDFAKIEVGRLLIDNVEFELRSAVVRVRGLLREDSTAANRRHAVGGAQEHALALLAETAHTKHIELVWQVAPDVPATVMVLGPPSPLFGAFVSAVLTATRACECVWWVGRSRATAADPDQSRQQRHQVHALRSGMCVPQLFPFLHSRALTLVSLLWQSGVGGT